MLKCDIGSNLYWFKYCVILVLTVDLVVHISLLLIL